VKNYTPLMYALRNNNPGLVDLLLNHKADVNLYAEDLASPLSIAASLNNIQFAELLIKNGAKLNLFTEVGFYPIKMGVDRQCNIAFMNILYDCESNFVCSQKLIEKLQTCSNDSLSFVKRDITHSMTLSIEEIEKRKSEYSKKIAAKTAKNVGIAVLSAAATTASYAATPSGGFYNVYHSNWDSNEFNRDIHKSLKNRKEYLEDKIKAFQTNNK
jgi:hypothetical protein